MGSSPHGRRRHRDLVASAASVALALAALVLAPGRALADAPRGELEWHGPGVAHRRSSDLRTPAADAADDEDTHLAESSLYLSPGLAARVYPRGEHGAFVEGLYRRDLELDGVGDAERSWRVDFFLARAGYAHRAVSSGRRFPDRVAHALTASLGVAAGFMRSDRTGIALPARAPVLGPTVAAEYGLHVGRFFFGWALAVDLLLHARGGMRSSRFLEWNVLPLGRVGVTFGPRVQTLRAAREEDGRGASAGESPSAEAAREEAGDRAAGAAPGRRERSPSAEMPGEEVGDGPPGAVPGRRERSPGAETAREEVGDGPPGAAPGRRERSPGAETARQEVGDGAPGAVAGRRERSPGAEAPVEEAGDDR